MSSPRHRRVGVAVAITLVAIITMAGAIAACDDTTSSGDTPNADQDGSTTDNGDGASSSGDSSSSSTDGGGGGQDGNTPIGDAGSDVDAKTPNIACVNNIDCHTGKCFLGICVCDPPTTSVQPDGTCGSGDEPKVCQEQDGGECLSPKTECPSGQIPGSGESSRSCGDFIAAVCCFKSCQGPAAISCCDLSDNTVSPAYCMRGWKTCKPGQMPLANPLDCK